MEITLIGIVRIHGGLIFLVFVSSLHPGIFILDKNKLWKSSFFLWNWKPCIHETTFLCISKYPTIHEICLHEFKWLHSTHCYVTEHHGIQWFVQWDVESIYRLSYNPVTWVRQKTSEFGIVVRYWRDLMIFSSVNWRLWNVYWNLHVCLSIPLKFNWSWPVM